MPLSAGTRLGPYVLQSLVGAGGMGEVYRSRDTALQRDVAIKILPEILALDPDRLVRFSREAQTLAALSHPQIAHIYGLVEAAVEGGPTLHALVMEWVEGEDLAQRLAAAHNELELRVGGLVSQSRHDNEHVEWIQHDLRNGDRVSIRIVDASTPSPPIARKRDDPESAEREERKYYERLENQYESK